MGPQCQTLRQGLPRRKRGMSGGLPKVFVDCWRLSQFSNREEVEQAVAALFKDDEGLPHLVANPQLPMTWLEKDAIILKQIATACVQEYDRVHGDGVALAELGDLEDSISMQVHD